MSEGIGYGFLLILCISDLLDEMQSTVRLFADDGLLYKLIHM